MYTLTANGFIKRLEDNAYIPQDENNVDYQQYLEWKSEGNHPEDEPIPEVNRAEQARAELAALEDEVKMVIGTMEFVMVSMQDMAIRETARLAQEDPPIIIDPETFLMSQKAWVKLVQIHARAIQLKKEAGL